MRPEDQRQSGSDGSGAGPSVSLVDRAGVLSDAPLRSWISASRNGGGGGAKLESGSGCKCSRGYCRSLFVCVYLLECGGVAKVEVSGAVCLRLPPPTLLKLV